jgi:hypothetical protein
MDYTVEMYRLDKRCKEGMKLASKTDIKGVELSVVEALHPKRPGYIVMIHETYVTKKNMMTGAEFRERYDTPYFCSPSSETFWSM